MRRTRGASIISTGCLRCGRACGFPSRRSAAAARGRLPRGSRTRAAARVPPGGGILRHGERTEAGAALHIFLSGVRQRFFIFAANSTRRLSWSMSTGVSCTIWPEARTCCCGSSNDAHRTECLAYAVRRPAVSLTVSFRAAELPCSRLTGRALSLTARQIGLVRQMLEAHGAESYAYASCCSPRK